MKSTTRKIIDIVIVLSSLACFVGLAYAHYAQEGIGHYMETESEVFCYGLCAFCYLGTFKMMSRNIKPVWVKWVFALVPATLFTIQIIFFNPFLHFIDWNVDWYYIKYGEIIPYKQFLENDLTYKVGLGEYRYLFCFVILYVLCAFVILLQSNRGERISKKIVYSISSFFDYGTTNTLGVLLDLYQRGRIDLDAICEYFNTMSCTASEKKEFEKCLTKYPCEMLYTMFLVKFGSVMPKEEYEFYCDVWAKYKGTDFPVENTYDQTKLIEEETKEE